jgi:Zn-dependent metalloprotease
MSDVFGSLVRQWKEKKKASQADWLIGKGLFSGKVQGRGLRSMAAPGTAYDDPVLGRDPQPSHMRRYYGGNDDNGGVHINSGIPNHAFYVAAMGAGGYAWEKVGKVWYAALKYRLRESSGFSDAANHTIAVAGVLFGADGKVQKAVRDGWKKVGVVR